MLLEQQPSYNNALYAKRASPTGSNLSGTPEIINDISGAVPPCFTANAMLSWNANTSPGNHGALPVTEYLHIYQNQCIVLSLCPQRSICIRVFLLASQLHQLSVSSF